MKAIPTKTSLLLFDTIFEKSNLKEGYHVADLGCGKSLSFLYSLANIVGKDGKIYGVDILPDVMESLERDVAHHRLNNITPLRGDIEAGLRLENESIQAVFLINTLNQASSTIAMLKEAYRLLKPDGRLIIVDWLPNPSPFGPLLSQRLSNEEIVDSLSFINLKIIEQFKPGLYHYGIVAGK
ncbi:MAG TPA: class I SAM-dependent methyltransferase [bacterium]|jgi:ubiquinone/menaquinone biosynthesis C-methylase UbiE|nr:class I SAM-dependent methyltransferase [bacterium]